MKISDYAADERPREKMLSRGPGALGIPELLAILLRTGTREHNVLDLAQELLASAGGSLIRLSSTPLDALCRIPGIKRDKAATLLAAFELGRRFLSEASWLPSTPLTQPEQAYRMMIPLLKGLEHEECWVILLNKAQLPIGKERMSLGGSDSTTIVVKDILKRALECGAHGLVLVHNHPGGDPRPSAGDIACTRQLQKAARMMDISLLDHVIIADDSYYSFTDDQLTRDAL